MFNSEQTPRIAAPMMTRHLNAYATRALFCVASQLSPSGIVHEVSWAATPQNKDTPMLDFEVLETVIEGILRRSFSV